MVDRAHIGIDRETLEGLAAHDPSIVDDLNRVAGFDIFSVLSDPEPVQQHRISTPRFGHVADDMREQFSGGKPGGPVWQ